MMKNDELTDNSELKLDLALEDLAAGIPVEEILAGAGSDAQWLAPLLQTSQQVAVLRSAAIIPAPAASLERLLAYGEALREPAFSAPASQPWWQTVWTTIFGADRPLLLNRGLGVTTLLAGLLLVCLMGGGIGGSLVLAAEGSAPGQLLYPVKRLGERTRLLFSSDPIEQKRMLETFNQRRQEEIQWLLANDEQQNVRFEGRIGSLTTSEVDFGFLVATVTTETEVTGQLKVGAKVRVEGITVPPNGLTILAITVLEPTPAVSPPSTPTVAPTPTPTATLLPLTPTATSRSARESTSDTIVLPPTSTASPTATIAEPSPTSSPSPQSAPPTLTPTPTPLLPQATATNTNSVPVIPGDDNGNSSNANDNEDNETDDDSSNDNDSEDNSGSNSGSGGGNEDNSGRGGGDDNSGKGSGDDDGK